MRAYVCEALSRSSRPRLVYHRELISQCYQTFRNGSRATERTLNAQPYRSLVRRLPVFPTLIWSFWIVSIELDSVTLSFLTFRSISQLQVPCNHKQSVSEKKSKVFGHVEDAFRGEEVNPVYQFTSSSARPNPCPGFVIIHNYNYHTILLPIVTSVFQQSVIERQKKLGNSSLKTCSEERFSHLFKMDQLFKLLCQVGRGWPGWGISPNPLDIRPC